TPRATASTWPMRSRPGESPRRSSGANSGSSCEHACRPTTRACAKNAAVSEADAGRDRQGVGEQVMFDWVSEFLSSSTPAEFESNYTLAESVDRLRLLVNEAFYGNVA